MAVEKPDSKRFDSQTEAMLFEGASLSQLSRLFSMDIRKVKAKLHGCGPVATRAGAPIYSIAEASRYLVEPILDIDEWIKRMNHTDLPMMLRKEYWAGMRSRQLYEEHAGDLWRTDKVIEHVTEILKTISMSLRLVSDKVAMEMALTPGQRRLTNALMDEALAGAHAQLLKLYENRGVGNGGEAAGVSDEEL